MPDTRLGSRGLRKRFGPVVALDGVDLAVRPGTVHGLVGENGAGKTTLMSTLFGLQRPDDGTVVIDDEAVQLSGARDGLRRGIGMVHQELAVVPDLTLLENLVLGNEPHRGPFIDWEAARKRADELAERSGVQLEWDTPAAQASVSALQRLEIVRLLHWGADTLILDEPTAVLAPQQVGELLELLRGLREQGRTVVFVSHKLDEVLDVADTVTVLRGGRTVTTVEADQTDADRLAELMVGESVTSVDAPAGTAGRAVLRVDGLAARDDRGSERLAGASLVVHAGEIVGVAGVAGNGQDELVECVVGLRHPSGGTVVLDDRDVTTEDVAVHRSAGLAYVSADRRHEGLAVSAPVLDNTLAGFHRDERVRTGPRLPRRRVRDFVAGVLERHRVRYGDLRDPVSALSGGNQQRLVVGRELAHAPTLLVAAQPTRGVDVRGIAAVHRTLVDLRDRGCGILLVSEELDELLGLSDRVVVLYRGRVVGEVPGTADVRAELGRLMTGGASRTERAGT